MITIKGIIGNEKGQYSLAKLIAAVKKEPAGRLHVVINSEGGDGDLAFDMYEYLHGLGRPITTECCGICASAASILFLAGDKRIAGCPIMIHNPWMETAGDSEQLREASEWIGKFEKRVEKFYSEQTGLDAATLSALMKQETYLSPSEAVAFGFATSSRQVAKALIHTSINQNKNQMATKKEKKQNRLLKALQVLMEDEEETPKMLDLETADGAILTIEREEGAPEVGDAASPDGTHTMPDGSVITVEGGVITAITVPEGVEELEQLRTENEQLRQEVEQLRASAKTTEEAAQLNAIKMAGGAEWLAKQCSHYKPAGRANVQRTGVERQGRVALELQKKKEELMKKRGL